MHLQRGEHTRHLACRLAALADGIEPPENMKRCFANNYDIEVRTCFG